MKDEHITQPFGKFFNVLYCVVTVVMKILFPTTVEGLEKLPKESVLLCANHSSNWDPILVVLALPMNYRLHIMAKEELFHNPILAWLIRKCGGFPVDRGNTDIKSIKTAMQTIKSGENLLVFPEGTVIDDGIGRVDGLPAHAKSGVAVIGIRTGAKLIPVFVGGKKRLFHRTRIVFGGEYTPVYTGRHGTAEEMQKIADDLLSESYALGGQAVGGKPL